mgnify:CR=1 FL=1
MDSFSFSGSCSTALPFFAGILLQRILICLQYIGFQGVFFAGFIQHFQEKNIGELRNILVIGNTVVTQNIAEIP